MDDDDVGRIEFNCVDTPSGALLAVTNSNHLSEK